MAIVPMQKVAVIAHKAHQEDVINLLHEEGVLQVQKSDQETEPDHIKADFKRAELEAAIETLLPFASKETQETMQKPTNVNDILFAATHTDVLGIIRTLSELEQRDTDAHKELQDVAEQKALLAPWQQLPASAAGHSESETTLRLPGTLPQDQEAALNDALKAENILCEMQRIGNYGNDVSYVAYVWKQNIQRFEEIATTYGWTQVQFPKGLSSPAQSYEESIAHEKMLHEVLKKNKKQREQLSVELPNLIKVRTFMQWLADKQSVRDAMGETESTATILGWMPRERIELIESKLQNLSKAIVLLKIKPDANEEPPVLLRNNAFITPFESVTTLYGLPLPSEMDPTMALSPFFALYFGLCLTDAGYGAVIALIFAIILWKTKKKIHEAPLFWLLFLSGIVTFIVSIPFGGWFGLTPQQVPEFLTYMTNDGQRYFLGQVWNLSEQSGINFLQNLSLILGLTHLFFGMFLAGMHKWVHGKKVEALWMDFTNHLLLGAALFVAFAPEALHQTALYVLYAVIALSIWGKGYGNPWYLRPIMGALGLVNLSIGLLSNGLSYLRILALGLVTGAIALAVNQVAIELSKLFPLWIGIPVLILVAVMGHTVSIALNTLGSFIHSGRLQFIEFFSQFFEGGGKPFAPFKRSAS